MDDAGLIVAVATEMVRRFGEKARSYLRDQAELATGMGDSLSAAAWSEIAAAADAILRELKPPT